MKVHPKGPQARLLLTSVFGPYAQNDRFGSRVINPMELFHNQVTRAQGAFSPRIFHRSWGLMMIQENVSSPSTLLDFPTLEIFERELSAHHYDIVGISSIVMNVGKVEEMCRTIRRRSPHSMIVVGGHVTAIPEIENLIDADHFVRGDGISWMRRLLGQDETAPIRHPETVSSFGHRAMGLRLPNRMGRHIGSTAATIIPSVGCPMGCNFCTTSAFFGGKGKFVNFYETGEELFGVMNEMEAKLKLRSFFVMDENFLLYRKRALELLALMRQHGKSWELFVFASVNAIRKYTMEELVELGISWIWIGLESPRSQYGKLEGVDTKQLVDGLHEHGIKVLGSTIIGLEHHTPENIDEEIAHAIDHGADCHQFMLYIPLPGTPLYQEMAEQGRLLDVDLADIHGQYKFSFRHSSITRDDSKEYLDGAFKEDFEQNGPSLYRICRTMLKGWRRYRDCPDQRVRARFEAEVNTLRFAYSGMLWAMERHLKRANEPVSKEIRDLREEMAAEFGIGARLAANLVGPLLWWSTQREERRLAGGQTYEPETFIDRRHWGRNVP